MKKILSILILLILFSFQSFSQMVNADKVTTPLIKIKNSTTVPNPTTGLMYGLANHLYFNNMRLDSIYGRYDSATMYIRNDVAGMDAIITPKLKEGIFCYVKSDKVLYQYVPTNTPSPYDTVGIYVYNTYLGKYVNYVKDVGEPSYYGYPLDSLRLHQPMTSQDSAKYYTTICIYSSFYAFNASYWRQDVVYMSTIQPMSPADSSNYAGDDCIGIIPKYTIVGTGYDGLAWVPTNSYADKKIYIGANDSATTAGIYFNKTTNVGSWKGKLRLPTYVNTSSSEPLLTFNNSTKEIGSKAWFNSGYAGSYSDYSLTKYGITFDTTYNWVGSALSNTKRFSFGFDGQFKRTPQVIFGWLGYIASGYFSGLFVEPKMNYTSLVEGSGKYSKNNYFIGQLAGNKYVTTNPYATVGYSAYDNLGIGYKVLTVDTSGHSNVGHGSYSLSACIDGNENTAYGVRSSKSLIHASRTTSFGTDALYSNNSNDAIGLGYRAGYGYDLPSRLYLGSGDSTSCALFGNMLTNKYWLNGKLYVKTVSVGNSANRMIVQDTLTGEIMRYPIPSGGGTYTAGYRIGLNGTAINNISYRKDIDSVSSSIPYTSTLVKGVVIDTITGKLYRKKLAEDLWTIDGTTLTTKVAAYKTSFGTGSADSLVNVMGGLYAERARVNGLAKVGSLQVGNYNVSVTGSVSLPQTAVTSVGTGLGLSGGTIISTGTILLDTANISVLSRQRAAHEYQPKGSYLSSLSGAWLYADTSANKKLAAYYTTMAAIGLRSLPSDTGINKKFAAYYDMMTKLSAKWSLADTSANKKLVGFYTYTQGLAGKAATNQTMYMGTTAVAINRGTGALTLAGVSVDNVTGIVATANGGTGANITPVLGGLVYTNATTMGVIGSATAGKVLQANGTSTPTYSTPTYPSASGTTGKVLKSDGTNIVYSTETYASPGTAGNVLQSDGTNYVVSQNITQTAAPANLATSGNLITLTAGVAVGLGDVCYIASTGKTALCKADAIANCPYAFCIATGTISQDAAGTFLTKGVVRNDSWSGWTVGGLLYISVTGSTTNTLTQTAPSSSNNVIMPVGVALASKIIYFFGNMNSVEKL